MKIYLLMLVLSLSLSLCLFADTIKHEFPNVKFFATDSTFTEKHTFKVNEPILLHCVIYNLTDKKVVYQRHKKYKKLGSFHEEIDVETYINAGDDEDFLPLQE